MSKYKYQDGNGNLMLQKYQHYVKKYICTNKNLKKLNCISVRYISTEILEQLQLGSLDHPCQNFRFFLVLCVWEVPHASTTDDDDVDDDDGQ